MRITEYVLVTDNLTLKILNLINVIESAGGKAENHKTNCRKWNAIQTKVFRFKSIGLIKDKKLMVVIVYGFIGAWWNLRMEKPLRYVIIKDIFISYIAKFVIFPVFFLGRAESCRMKCIDS